MKLVPKDIPSFSSQKNRKLYSAIKPPSFSHLMPLFFLNHANEFLILTEESGNRPVSSFPNTKIFNSAIYCYICCSPRELYDQVWCSNYFCYVLKTKMFSSTTASILHVSVYLHEKKVISQ